MGEQPQGTYFFDSESTTEMARLIEQDRTATEAMGGPLAGLPALAAGAQVLDLACGPGSWVIEAAYTSPDIEVAGVDISRTMIDYATARARSQQISNVSFGVMDITQPLDFSDHSFDLVNARALLAVLRRDAWQPFIAECTRVLKPEATLRLTEAIDFGTTNSVATEQLQAALLQTLRILGYSFSVDGRSCGLVPVLPAFLRKAGYQNVHTVGNTIEFSADTHAWIDFYHNYQILFLQSKPLLLKAGTISEEAFDQAYQQMFVDMKQPDFGGILTFVSVIGTRAG